MLRRQVARPVPLTGYRNNIPLVARSTQSGDLNSFTAPSTPEHTKPRRIAKALYVFFDVFTFYSFSISSTVSLVYLAI